MTLTVWNDVGREVGCIFCISLSLHQATFLHSFYHPLTLPLFFPQNLSLPDIKLYASRFIARLCY